VRLGVDVGSVRIGLAVSDPDGILATPLETVPRVAVPRVETGSSAETGPRATTQGHEPSPDLLRIAQLVRDLQVVQVIVGLPITLRGQEGQAATLTRRYAEDLAKLIDPVPVAMTDERMSTAAAARRLSERGVRGRRQRAVVDQAAAVEILQGWLDACRRIV
jgi:putative holliday junction resolvase